METRLLTEPEFQSTFAHPMRNITGREDSEQPEGVLDLEPYLSSIPTEQFGAAPLLPDAPPSAVYRNDAGGYDHVLYPCRRDNFYLVVVVAFRIHQVFGHAFLDLGNSCGS